MIKALFLITLIFTSTGVSQISHAQNVVLIEFRNRVLILELGVKTNEKVAAYGQCILLLPKRDMSAETQFKNWSRVLKESSQTLTQEATPVLQQKAIQLLEIERQLYQAEKNNASCSKAITDAKQKQDRRERKKFDAAYLAAGLVSPTLIPFTFKIPPYVTMLIEMDPHCTSVVGPSAAGYVDSNPCFAGGGIIFRNTFLKNPSDRASIKLTLDEKLALFEKQLLAISQSLNLAKPGTALSLELPGFSITDSILLYALAFTASSSKVGYVGHYSRLIFDQTWIEQASAETAYQRYMKLKDIADIATSFDPRSSEKKVQLVLKGHDLTKWNRHNWASAALYLHFAFRGEFRRARLIPVLLGTAYESLDAVSHLKEGLTWGATIENFKTDRQRYVDGARFAKECFR